jgi:polyhydroxyalkanoate synthesis regulator phasin
MSSPVKKVYGVGLMIVSVVGLILSLFGLIFVARTGRQITKDVQETLGVTASALETTSQSLSLAEEAFGEAADSIGAAEGMTQDVQQTLTDTNTLIDSLGGVFGSELPEIITHTRQSLEAAEQSAAVVDGVLLALTYVPLLNVEYDPEVPLSESIGNIDASLETLPQSLTDISGDLEAAQGNLQSVDSDLDRLSGSLADIRQTLTEAQSVMVDYRELVDDLTERVKKLQTQVPRWVRTGTIGVTFVLVWLAFSQVGLLFQGWEMLTFNARQLEERVEALEAKAKKK